MSRITVQGLRKGVLGFRPPVQFKQECTGPVIHLCVVGENPRTLLQCFQGSAGIAVLREFAGLIQKGIDDRIAGSASDPANRVLGKLGRVPIPLSQ